MVIFFIHGWLHTFRGVGLFYISSMQIIGIVAVDSQMGIGYKNELLFHNKSEMQHFRKTTTGHAILMGRKTFESIGRALPNRLNLVLSRGNIKAPKTYTFKDMRKAVIMAHALRYTKLFVVGGSSIYRQTQKYWHELILTRYKAKGAQCDRWFNFNESDFKLEKVITSVDGHYGIEYYKRVFNKNGDTLYNVPPC